MRFKDEIWSYFIRFRDEERFVRYKKEKRKGTDKESEVILAFYDMEDDRFSRLYNTYCWLAKFNSRTLRFSEEKVLIKPSNEEILEALNYIEKDASSFFEFAKQYTDKEMRLGMQKKAKRELGCVAYYKQLVEDDFYKDKEIKELDFSRLENEAELEIPTIKKT